MFVGEEELNKLIEGRVEPHIYAFSTDTIPKYTKIGDTYRSVNTRLNEWKEYFPNLKKEYEESAKIDNVFFRDYAVHKYLEEVLLKKRLEKNDIPENIYYSKEFFKDILIEDLDNAISDIKNDYNDNAEKYSFYDVDTLAPIETHYERGSIWELRDNQQDAVDNFKIAIDNGRTNLLMYAVMRFGKSFTSLCCAKEIEDLKLIVVVSAKADVKEEWKKNTEIPGNFVDFEFKCSKDLIDDEHLISNHLSNSNGKVIVLFLTLQDLMGDVIKDKHKELFAEQTNIDLLIIDETHFGARADKYGAVLKQPAKAINKHDKEEINDITDYTEEINKTLNAKYKLHLSGTPYRILMGSEFQKEDIISFCQYSDIVDEQEKWDKENLLKDVDNDDNPIKEWNNPYYGFPQMIRFAFNPNKSSRERLEEFRKDGYAFALSKLLEPKSTTKDTSENKHKFFIYEDEVLELLEAIDGSKNDNEILSFLDYDKIKKGNMCRHIVMVLPYCASCDAMENLITQNSDKFKNLKDYEIINISGIDNANKYGDITSVKRAIANNEKENKKTITLTVNRMLTGSTVEQWDTMIYLKDTASPQEYDQAIFRLQSQYVKTYKDDKTGDTIKYNMKPQTLLVDFCIDRIFKMQELKSQIYNVNTDEAGNSKLKDRIERELKISPIIVINKDKIEQVTATNILEAVSNYSKNRGVAEETNDIPVDLGLRKISEIWDVISRENELGSKNGFNIEPIEGDGDEIETPEPSVNEDDGTPADEDTNNEPQSEENNNSNEKDPVKQFRMYYARILYYSFLTTSDVNSLDDIISSLNTENNTRIFNNMGLNKVVLVALKNNMNKFMLSSLDYKIQNMNKLSNDTDIEPIKRANTANQKFGKLGESEVVTPEKITTSMIALLPNEFLKNCIENKIPILDIASKEAEFAIALYQRFKAIGYNLDEFKDLIYSIPTSNITYEFTRKIYEILGLNINNIAEKFNSYDLLKIKNGNNINYERITLLLNQNKQFNKITLQDEVQAGGDDNMVEFGAVVGNPPYQENISNETSNKSLGKQLFPWFIKIAINLTQRYISFITPSRWFTADAQDKSFIKLRKFIKENNHIKKIYNYKNASDLFLGVIIKGGLNYNLFDKNYNGLVEFYNCYNSKQVKEERNLFEEGLDVIIDSSEKYGILKKVTATNFISLMTIASGRNAFGIIGKESVVNTISKPAQFNNSIELRCKNNIIRYISPDKITKSIEIFNSYKIFISKSSGDPNTDLKVVGLPYIAKPRTACTDSLIPMGCFETFIEAENLSKYIKTRFLRFMVSILKSSQNVTQIVYRFVPLQDFTENSDIDWSKSIEEIDKQLYQKYNLNNEEIAYIESMIKPME